MGYIAPAPPASRVFYRGTTEVWECAAMWGDENHHPELRSGKSALRGIALQDVRTMTANEINAEIVERVCVETALGTPNTYSHFVPCADEYGMSARFGHGGCFEFKIYCALYGPTLQEIERYVAERANLSPAVVPMFKGGKVEWLAYSGTMITSVFARRGAERSTNLWSLD